MLFFTFKCLSFTRQHLWWLMESVLEKRIKSEQMLIYFLIVWNLKWILDTCDWYLSPKRWTFWRFWEYFVYLFVFNAFLLLTDIFCWYLDLYVMSTGHCVCTGSALDSLCGRGRGSGLSPYCQGELTPLGLWNAASLDVLLTTCSFLNWQLYSHISPMLM